MSAVQISRQTLGAPEELQRHVMSTGKLHVDNTPVPVLAPENGNIRTGRLWMYVCDDRPAGSETAPGVWFGFPVRAQFRSSQTYLKF